MIAFISNRSSYYLFEAWREKKKITNINDFLLLESATSLARQIRRGELKSVDVVAAFIKRIRDVNPILNCVVDRNYDAALKLAKVVDFRIESKWMTEAEMEKQFPFLGVPFTINESFEVEGLKNTSGSLNRRYIVARRNAQVVKLMKCAGAIPLAVTNVSETCMWWETSNNVYGRTNNPYDSRRTVGGSSGGEGCLNAVAGTAFGIGSDVGGSIRMTAFFNGVFGHKPSPSIVSNDGHWPMGSRGYLCVGPICRYAIDLAPILKVMAGSSANGLKLDERVDVESLHFYFMYDHGDSPFVSKVHPEIISSMQRLKTFYNVDRVADLELENMKYSSTMWLKKVCGADYSSFARNLGEDGIAINPVLEFFKWLIRCSKHTLPAIGLAFLEKFHGRDSINYHQYMDMCAALRFKIESRLGDDGVLVVPTHPQPAPFHYQPIFRPFDFAYTGIYNVLGLPATHCPMGFTEEGLPIGLQIIAKRNNDHLTLAVARDLNNKFGGWKPPPP